MCGPLNGFAPAISCTPRPFLRPLPGRKAGWPGRPTCHTLPLDARPSTVGAEDIGESQGILVSIQRVGKRLGGKAEPSVDSTAHARQGVRSRLSTYPSVPARADGGLPAGHPMGGPFQVFPARCAASMLSRADENCLLTGRFARCMMDMDAERRSADSSTQTLTGRSSKRADPPVVGCLTVYSPRLEPFLAEIRTGSPGAVVVSGCPPGYPLQEAWSWRLDPHTAGLPR